MDQCFGIDVGGTGIKGAIVNLESGELLTDRFRIPTPDGAAPKDVVKAIKEILSKVDYAGVIGCGFPSVILHGTAMTAANIHSDWIGKNVNQYVEKGTGYRTFAVNDADAAGVAEMRFGKGKGQNGVVLFLTLGTGIGSALFKDGVLIPNLEFGHMELHGMDAEHYASAVVREKKKLSWKQYSKRLQEYLIKMESLFWPDLFIIGGGISKVSQEFLPLIKTRTPIFPAELRNNAGIIGAALFASDQIK